MSHLIVVGFKKDLLRASAVLNELSEMSAEWVIDLRDAVAVSRDYSGKLRVHQSYQMTTGTGTAWGSLWGALIGLTLAIPFTAGAAGGAIDANWWKDSYGISDDFVREVGAMVQPGDSAIFALLRSADPAYVAEQFRGFGGTVLRSTLTKEQADKVQAVLDDQK